MPVLSHTRRRLILQSHHTTGATRDVTHGRARPQACDELSRLQRDVAF